MEDIEIILEEKDIDILDVPQDEDTKQIRIEHDDFIEDRYHRLRLIPWWDQNKLRESKIMVVGAGALGNEIIKNLAMLGIGKIFVVDSDTVEISNLSRSVLFRKTDEGKSKSEIVAKKAKEINPDIKIQHFQGNVVYELGAGVFRSMDVILGGLDNREARLAINKICWKVNRPWIDGGIEVLNGIVRVFIPPDSACYECTMNELDYKLLEIHKSCPKFVEQGKVPTTPTIASIIAAIQVQEALKIIHKHPDLSPLKGKGFLFNGQTFDCFTIEYQYKEDCLSHETYQKIIEIDQSNKDITLKEMLKIIQQELGKGAILEFDKDIAIKYACNKCGKKENLFKVWDKLIVERKKCAGCGEEINPEITHTITGQEDFLEMTLQEFGIPPFDILTGRDGLNMIHFELTGDKKDALGEIYDS